MLNIRRKGHSDTFTERWLALAIFIPNSINAILNSFCFFQVTGVVADSGGQANHILSGTWDDKIESAKIIQSSRGGSGSEGKQKTVYQTLSPKLLWKKYPLP